jgi:LacI family transcriptional regulator, galactose operon repressor
MDKRVSIKDIARHVGVSTALISYVLNNKDERVSPEMALKIRKAAAELNYRPNLIAKSLKSGKTNTLGLIVADISNPFFSGIARIIEDEAKKYGYTVIFGSSDESVEKSQGLIEALLNRQVDAMIIAPAEFTERQILSLQERHVPYVLIDRYFPEIESNCVRINNYQASYNAVEHLVKMGNRRIVMMAYNTSMQHIGDRKRGYLEALRDNQIPAEEDWLAQASYHHLEEDVERVMRRLLLPEPRVDAFFFATNSLAVQGLKQIVKLGVKVPEEVAIISFDESDAFDFFYSPITYIRQSLTDIGREAVRLVMENIGRNNIQNTEVIVNASLVIRESCGGKEKSTLRVAAKRGI